MTDIVNKATRSRMMAAIKGSNTKPELDVRRYLHATGLRFRVNDRRLPGSPDLVFPALRVAIFVHGCFWHRHPGCVKAAMPSTNIAFWDTKFAVNVSRDRKHEEELTAKGWRVMTIWECEATDPLHVDQLFWQIVATSPG
ncbi:very short patch repair endonuclease [Hydrogenophaga sp.]|uniref:very short patch repair endonuclease n=1 Tax=Hydrogenophaga sp. TaxID=1904254 RepID=UPI00273607B7|nr:very short patch repair endonuclease [Hydrogenophaga sp.]MDP3883676.1 very short patch repair endonuclease [Hydrogenophaga sp.]